MIKKNLVFLLDIWFKWRREWRREICGGHRFLAFRLLQTWIGTSTSLLFFFFILFTKPKLPLGFREAMTVIALIYPHFITWSYLWLMA